MAAIYFAVSSLVTSSGVRSDSRQGLPPPTLQPTCKQLTRFRVLVLVVTNILRILREEHLVIGVRTPGLNKLGKIPLIYFSKTM